MKATVTINSRGVVTLPAKLRRAAGIRPDDQMIVETTPEGLLLRPAVTLPIEIYSEARACPQLGGEAAQYWNRGAVRGESILRCCRRGCFFGGPSYPRDVGHDS